MRAEAGRSAWPRVASWRALAVAASLVVVALGSWRLGAHRAAGNAIADQVLASHVRSLMAGHLTDVASSDHHTVKPWFDGRLDFSPPVPELAGEGFPLLGGRLDYLDGHPVAALVYGRRKHVINVFLWPGAARADAGAAPATQHGYHIVHAAFPGMTTWIVSDLG